MSSVRRFFATAIARLRDGDQVLISCTAILLVLGVLFSMAASPSAAARIRIDEAFYFAARQAAYAAIGAFLMLAMASANARTVRRVGVVLTVVFLPLCALAAWLAPEVKGAQRAFDLGVISLQPSEILKPALVVAWAWLLSAHTTGTKQPFSGRTVAFGLFGLAAVSLLAQPDIGQTALLSVTFAAMLLVSGLALRWLLAGGGAAALAGWAIYNFYPHARARIDAFINPEGDGAYQVNRALDAIAAGGVFGRGPGEGVIKRSLPDAHADFVFAVAAEEFGLLASLGVIALFAVIAFRGLSRAGRMSAGFERLTVAGMVTLITTQAAIHIAVNLSLLPAKGMTLPFISFGGSSMVGAALAMGMCIAALRDQPGVYAPSAQTARAFT
jgi:cell division protein FtsW